MFASAQAAQNLSCPAIQVFCDELKCLPFYCTWMERSSWATRTRIWALAKRFRYLSPCFENMCKVTQQISNVDPRSSRTTEGMRVKHRRTQSRRLAKCDTSWNFSMGEKIIWYSLTEGFLWAVFSSFCAPFRFRKECRDLWQGMNIKPDLNIAEECFRHRLSDTSERVERARWQRQPRSDITLEWKFSKHSKVRLPPSCSVRGVCGIR
jgi:hypothetical protein